MSDPGHNLRDLHGLILDANKTFDRIAEERSENTEDTAAHLKVLENKGISRRAFRMARAYSKMSVEDRQGFDTAYSVCRDALGMPVQPDMFDNLKPIEPKKRGRKPKAEVDETGDHHGASGNEPVADGAAA